MPQKSGQYLIQREEQKLTLSPQMRELARLIEMPLPALEQEVREKLESNVALEDDSDVPMEDDFGMDSESAEGNDDVDSDNEDIDNSDGYTQADDDGPFVENGVPNIAERLNGGATKSFMDELVEQIADYDVTPLQRELIEYLIASLNDDGFLDCSTEDLSYDIMFHTDIQATETDIDEAIKVLQQFTPAGIGAHNLQECLLIQINRKIEETDVPASLSLLNLEREIIQSCYDLFLLQKKEQIAGKLGYPIEKIEEAFAKIKRLDPRPGRPLCESAMDQVATVVPDFVVTTTSDGDISFTLNHGNIPAIRVSAEMQQQLDELNNIQKKTSRDKDAIVFTKKYVTDAQQFVDAIKQRNDILIRTMKSLIQLQRDFILSQDESTLKPLRLVDVANKVGVDISTVSRIRTSKYAEIDGTNYPLSAFFLRDRRNAEGDILVHSDIQDKIKQIIDNEDRKAPYSDQQLEGLLQKEGIAISRRTIAKYREGMGILSSKDRKL